MKKRACDNHVGIGPNRVGPPACAAVSWFVFLFYPASRDRAASTRLALTFVAAKLGATCHTSGMANSSWVIFALLGAFSAAIVNLLMKQSMQQLDATIAVVLQSAVSLLTLCVLATVTRKWTMPPATARGAIGFAIGAGVAAGFAWFFGYRALKMTEVAKATSLDRLSLVIAVILALVFLGERPAAMTWLGVCLMVVGAVLVSLNAAK